MNGTGKTTGKVLDVARQRGGAQPGVVTLLDRSRFGNDGAMTAITWVRLPSRLWVMSCNGVNSRVQIPNHPSLDPRTGDFTFSVWFNHPLADATSWQDELFCKIGGTSRYQIHMRGALAGAAVNTLRVRVGSAAGLTTIDTVGTYNDATWHLITVVVDNGTLVYVYMDGQFLISGAHAAGDIIPTSDLFIGSDQALTAAYFWPGLIGSTEIYYYALTPGQVLKRYEATKRSFGR